MSIKQELERIEKQTLSKHAVCSVDTKGREREIHPCDLRTEFQRDRDRILHCKSFRRLKYKTQVFLSPQGDHYRTRLTHTLEVSQVARTIARCLRLNEDLAEAIALGHDLGHTPFGHIGERTLNEIYPDGFRHNLQSLRVVEKIENGTGLNLTWEVRDGIRNHSGDTLPATLEAMCVRIADRIAYINHDIDDSVRAGILREEELPKYCLDILGYSHGERINRMILDIVSNSMDKPTVDMSEEVKSAAGKLRQFMFSHVYQAEWRRGEERKCDFVISTLYNYFLEHPAQMPLEYIEIEYKDGISRAVCDYIACMTDRYAIAMFKKLFVPSSFSEQHNADVGGIRIFES